MPTPQTGKIVNAEQSLLALEPQPIRGEEKSITEALHSFSEFGKA